MTEDAGPAPGPASGGEAPTLRLPDPGLLFAARAARLQALAKGHAAPEWLLLLSRIAAGQALAARDVPAGSARAPAGGPPLAYDGLPRDGAWRQMLARIVAVARTPGLPAESDAALRLLAGARAEEVERLADAILVGDVRQESLACVPFAGAALQAWLAALASSLDPRAVAPSTSRCPVCGGPPVAAVVRGSDRRRYVTCAFCAAEWHVLRVHCAICGNQQVEYLHAEGDRGAQAEACSACRGYLKIFDEEQRPGADAAADDAATLALDLLVSEEGYRRAGPNFYVSV